MSVGTVPGPGAFATLHRRDLLRVALGICRDPVAAEDLVQDTLERLLPRWDRVSTADRPLAYVRTAMVRVYLDQAAPGARATGHATLSEAEIPGPDAFVEVESLDAAVELLKGLPRRARAVLTLRYIEDLGDSEIAQILGISTSTVRVTAHRALRALSVTPEPKSLSEKRSF